MVFNPPIKLSHPTNSSLTLWLPDRYRATRRSYCLWVVMH